MVYGKLSVVVGGQYGSEAKGHVAGWLAREDNNLVADGKLLHKKVVGIRTGGPNAGHTAYDPEGRKWALRQIPVVGVTNYDAQLVIAAGSEVDPEVLRGEIVALEASGIPVKARLIIDGSATLLEPRHRDAEAADGLVGRIGSTGKGIGAARSDRIMRRALTIQQVADTEWFDDLLVRDTAPIVNALIRQGWHAIIEGTQGYGLGLHGKHYPQCTAADVRAIDLLSAVGISPWSLPIPMGMPHVWVVLRVYPIRVAGNSGSLSGETSWADLGLPEEYTTVTQKVRRVGDWDSELAFEAVYANGGSFANIALTMVDQKIPAVAGASTWKEIRERGAEAEVRELLAQVQNDVDGVVRLIGTGPNTIVKVDDL